MFGRIVGALIAMAVLGSCASPVSPYSFPDKGVEFHYGNFCGSHYPKFEPGLSTAQRIKYLANIPPADSIDLACKSHDLCYEIRGHDDASCDVILSKGLRGPAGKVYYDQSGGFQDPAAAWEYMGRHSQAGCFNLAGEIVLGVGMLKSNVRHDGATRSVLRRAVVVPMVPIKVLTQQVYPEQPGLCFLKDPMDLSREFPGYGAFLGARGWDPATVSLVAKLEAEAKARIEEYDTKGY